MTSDSPAPFTVETLSLLISFIALASIVSWIAYLNGYFALPYKNHKNPQIGLIDLFASFLLLFLSYFVLAPLLSNLLINHSSFLQHAPLSFALFQIGIFVFAAASVFLYNLIRQSSHFKDLWKDRSFAGSRPVSYDIGMGVLTWFIAIPTVLAATQIGETFTEFFFGIPYEDQLAIKYLKSALNSPPTLIAALFSILILAPLLEEFLFRAILQSSIRKKWGPRASITISSLCFALFHFSPVQSTTNIVLITSLFTLALYLGFLYEKTRSLIAPIVLHVTFNSASVIKIIFIDL